LNETNHAEGAEPLDTGQAGGADASAELAAAEARATENRNSYLRAVAELENFRKRSEREVDNARKYAIERFAQELVTVGDALEAGINAGTANPGPAATAPRLRQGGHQDHRPGRPALRSGVA
jgi:molecular chaperone GrpE